MSKSASTALFGKLSVANFGLYSYSSPASSANNADLDQFAPAARLLVLPPPDGVD